MLRHSPIAQPINKSSTSPRRKLNSNRVYVRPERTFSFREQQKVGRENIDEECACEGRGREKAQVTFTQPISCKFNTKQAKLKLSISLAIKIGLRSPPRARKFQLS